MYHLAYFVNILYIANKRIYEKHTSSTTVSDYGNQQQKTWHGDITDRRDGVKPCYWESGRYTMEDPY